MANSLKFSKICLGDCGPALMKLTFKLLWENFRKTLNIIFQFNEVQKLKSRKFDNMHRMNFGFFVYFDIS